MRPDSISSQPLARRRTARSRFGGPRLLLVLLALAGPASLASAVGDRGADGRFERRDSFHFTLFQDVDIDESGGLRGSRKFEQDLLAELEGAFDTLDRLLGLRPEKKIEVFVWDPQLFEEQFAGLFKFPAAGFYGGAIHVRGATQVTPRLVRVLHHELVHAAFDAAAPRFRPPAWLNEGVAEWFEARAAGHRALPTGAGQALSQWARSGQLLALAHLSGPSFGGFGPEAASIAYLQSHGFIAHLVDRFGERDLARFVSAVVRSRNLDRAARRVYRDDLAGLESSFRASLGSR